MKRVIAAAIAMSASACGSGGDADTDRQSAIPQPSQPTAMATVAQAVATNTPSAAAESSPSSSDANGTWDCTGTGWSGRFKIMGHKSDEAAIARGEAAYCFAEQAKFEVSPSAGWTRQGLREEFGATALSGKVDIGMGCPASKSDCAGFERVVLWSFPMGYFPSDGFEQVTDKTGRLTLQLNQLDYQGKPIQSSICKKM